MSRGEVKGGVLPHSTGCSLHIRHELGHRYLERLTEQEDRLQARVTSTAFEIAQGVQMHACFHRQFHLAPILAQAVSAQHATEYVRKVDLGHAPRLPIGSAKKIHLLGGTKIVCNARADGSQLHYPVHWPR